MFDPDENGVYVRLQASAPRRYFALGVLWGLAALLVWVVAAAPPAPGWQVFLVGLAAGVAWLAERLRRATLEAVELTSAGLRMSSGETLAALDDIAGVERGVFAFKPSNGFVVTLRRPGPRAWQPGLWWRIGRRMGLGGVTPSGQGKAMADTLAYLIAMRDGAPGR